MPEISRFFGIIIAMYYREHAPPHFHAKYAGQRAAFAISDLRIIEGGLPRRAISLVLEWPFFTGRSWLITGVVLSAGRISQASSRWIERCVMHYVTEATYVSDYKIKVRFEKGEVKLVDLAPYLDGPIFEPLKEIAFFRSFTVNQDIDTVTWPNNADFSPEFLYEVGQPISEHRDQSDGLERARR